MLHVIYILECNFKHSFSSHTFQPKIPDQTFVLQMQIFNYAVSNSHNILNQRFEVAKNS